MAQRGGCVVSHVRFGKEVFSPLIPRGGADAILASEPCEAARNLGYLKPGGLVVTSPEAISPVTASLGGARFDGREMIEYISRHADVRVVETRALLEACGSIKPLNIALIGCAVAHGQLSLDLKAISDAICRRVAPRYIDMNLKALELGRNS